ncbi:MAG: efflux RND transporter periplasmic adaptor subunit, partial [Candidatus Hydrogenedentota bacterium]
MSTQEEYLSALKYRNKIAGSGFPDAEARADNLLASSRSRLLYWDITDEQIRRLEEQGRTTKTLTVVSPVSGVLIEKMDQALEGMYAKAGMNLYKIADLSSLWVHVDIYEYQLPWIKAGQEAKVEISYYPGENFWGKVLFFYPYLDEKTRTVRVCLEIPNTDDKVRPEMFATVTFLPVAAEDVVLVPEMAVLHSGERDIVVVDLGGGR